MDDLLGDVIQLDSDPSTAGEELKPNDVGFNPTSLGLFINLFGNTYKIATLTLV